MKYEMPALTDEQQEEAIKKCHAAIKSLAPIQGVAEQTSKICFEIALASLTTRKFMTYSEGGWGGPPVDLYTSPPVPVLKPIELPDRYDIASMMDVDKDDDGCLFLRDDVIEAIRAAGYEVKE